MSFFKNAIRRKLSSLVQSWLQEEPNIELKLGLLHSEVRVLNINFDVAVLNQLLDQSSWCVFQHVRVEHLLIRVSPWSVPAITFDVSGVDVSLLPRETREEQSGSSRLQRNLSESVARERTRILSLIDPQGAFLNETIANVLVMSSSKNHFARSTKNVILTHCQVKVKDIHVILQLPASRVDVSCFLKVEELSLDGLSVEPTSFFLGIICAVVAPRQESSLKINCSCIEIGLQEAGSTEIIVSSKCLGASAQLRNFQFLDFDVQVPNVDLEFSFSHISAFMMVYGVLFPKEVKGARNGRELWKAAASKIGCLISPRFSWYKVVDIVLLWVRYTQAYENLLCVVEYFAEQKLKTNVARMVHDKAYCCVVKHLYDAACEIEAELPVEAVGRARNVARCRGYSFHGRELEYLHCPRVIFWKVPLEFSLFLLSSVCCIFSWILYFLFVMLKGIFHQNFTVNKSARGFRVASDGSFLKNIIRLNLNEVSVNLFLIPIANNVSSEELANANANMNCYAFNLVAKTLCLSHVKDCTSKSLSFACGYAGISFASASKELSMDENAQNQMYAFSKGVRHVPDDNKRFVWVEPAPQLCFPKKPFDLAEYKNRAYFMLLQSYMGEMWLNWKKISTSFVGNDPQFLELPFFLCEFKSFLRDPYAQQPSNGMSKINLAIGRLNIDLDLLSLVSIYQLFDQILYSFQLSCRKVESTNSCLSGIGEELGEAKCANRLDSLNSDVTNFVLRLIPERNVQVGVVVVGPTIRVSLQDSSRLSADPGIAQGIGCNCFIFDLGKIEAAVWPSSPSFLAASTGFSETEIRCLHLEKTQLTEIDEQHHNGSSCLKGMISLDACLSLDGANAFWGGSEKIQRFPMLYPLSAIFQSSTRRIFLHSLQSITSLAVSFNGSITGVTVLLYMNELDALFQVLNCLLSLRSQFSMGRDSSFDDHFSDFTSNDLGSHNKISNGSRLWFMETRRFTISASLEVMSINIILDRYRKTQIMRNYASGSGSFASGILLKNHCIDSRLLTMLNLVDYGIGISLHQARLQIVYEEGLFEVEVNLYGLDSSIFRHSNMTVKCLHEIELEKLLLSPVNCLYEFSIPDFMISICAAFGNNLTSENCHSTIICGIPEVKSNIFCQKLSLAQAHVDDSNPDEASGHMIVINLCLGGIYMSEHSVKKMLSDAHGSNKLLCSLTAAGELQHVSCEIQGGLVTLETEALTTFANCFSAYLMCLTCLFQRVSWKEQHEAVEAPLSNYLSCQTKWMPQVVKFRQSDLGVVLAVADNSGGVWELMAELDFLLNVNLENLPTKVLFEISRLTIVSQHLPFKNCSQQMKESSLALHFSSTPNISADSLVPGEGSSNSSNTLRSKNADCRNFILKDGVVSISAERTVEQYAFRPVYLKNEWVGSGCISGLHLTITLADIQMLLILVKSLSTLLEEKGSDGKGEQKHGFLNQIQNDEIETTIPDGAIVAVKDLHQHMYLAVEAVDHQFRVVGTVHYSLVGESALFRVKYHNQRRWRSQVSWFSLTSLSAKNDKGGPLHLNFLAGSAFVNISSVDDKGSLWRTSSYKMANTIYDTDTGLNNTFSWKVVSLVNQRNNSAIAFIDGLPEFVKRPGSPFKVKIFNELTLTQEVLVREASLGSSGVGEKKPDVHTGRQPHILVTIDNVSLTIFDEVLGADEMFPLVKGCIDNAQFIVQILPTKMRIICTLSTVIYYLEARRSLWKEIVSPVRVCVFYHIKFADLDVSHLEALSHVYMGITKVDVSVTQLSLDIFLYIVGRLNLAGPFAVKRSMIFANCCKVKNQTGLNLLCNLDDGKDAVISGNQSGTIFIRQPMYSIHSQERRVSMTIQLAADGVATSPVHLSILEPQLVAWKARLISLKDSRTFPGPFIVVDISEKNEDGISIVVSPMLTIHNESGFSMVLSFRRPQIPSDESASVILRSGDTIDDTMAVFDSLNFSGGLKKALMSVTLGNFLLSFRPVIDHFEQLGKSVTVDWSEDLIGGKAVPICGILDKLNFRIKRAFGVCPLRSSFSTTCCLIKVDGQPVSSLHFLVRTLKRDVPLTKPPSSADASSSKTSTVAVHEQKEIFLYPTVQVFNHLQSEVLLHLSDNHPDFSLNEGFSPVGKQAMIPPGSSTYLYANPAIMYFTVTLTAFNSRSKPVNSEDWTKKLNKQKGNAHKLDIELEFFGGKYFASLRLSRGDTGLLEATIYTPYTVHNGTDHPLLFVAANHKSLAWEEVTKYGCCLPPERGCILSPKSSNSWFQKCNKIRLKMMEERASDALLDMDSISGFSELCLELQEEGLDHITKVGISASLPKEIAPSQLISLVPRYLICNESDNDIIFQHCYLGDGVDEATTVKSHQKAALCIKRDSFKRREISLFDSILKNHRNPNEDSHTFVRFCLTEPGWGCSGPICIASLGKFFLKFRKELESQQNSEATEEDYSVQYATVHTLEDGSSLVMNFQMPPNVALPYRIENCLPDVAIMFYQKGSEEAETLGSRRKSDYVWFDLCLPHKLIVHINEMRIQREINIDKLTSWKPFSKFGKSRGLASYMPLEKNSGSLRRNNLESLVSGMQNVGYEVFADGPTRVLRISEFSVRRKEERLAQMHMRVQLRLSDLLMHLLEDGEYSEAKDESLCSPIVIARFGGISLDSIVNHDCISLQIQTQCLNVENKWEGAPFAAMLRTHVLDDGSYDFVLCSVISLRSSNSDVKQIDYLSIVLKPIDLKLDEETLMRLVGFWRTSLADPNLPSRQFYFKYFEIHPIKIVASFLPGTQTLNYDSAQEALRSLLHSVIKVPTVNNMVVELNGVVLTHALVTARELAFKCAQHYSWYAMRSIYVARGSTLLPPAFASIFDDAASSTLDMFFDPSSGSVSLPGLSLGMFKFVSKCIDTKGFSGTKRYLGDLGKTLRTAGSNVMFATITEISDSVLKGAEVNGFEGMVNGFHQGILKLAMEPSLIGAAVLEGGPDRIIKLDKSPGIDELYIEGYLQAILDSKYNQAYLKVRVTDDQVILKNLPPNNSIINEIVNHVKNFLMSKGLLKGEANMSINPLRRLRGENEWRIGPTILTLCEHLFVSFSIRMLRKQTSKLISGFEWRGKSQLSDTSREIVPPTAQKDKGVLFRKWGITKFVLSGIVAYVDGRLCRCIPNTIARRIVSGFLLSFLDNDGR